MRCVRGHLAVLLLLVQIVAAIATTCPAGAAPGALDPAYGADGRVRFGFGGGDDFPVAVLAQSNGRFVVASSRHEGVNAYACSIIRYNADGSRDGGFGVWGETRVQFGAGYSDAVGLAAQSDGRLILLAWTPGQFHLARFEADGRPDTTFGIGGRVTGPYTNVEARALAIQGDDRILVAGNLTYGASGKDLAVFRFTSGGQLDPTFNGSGGASANVFTFDEARAMTVQSNGRIVVAGDAYSFGAGIEMVRFLTNGALDSSFDGDGKAFFNPGFDIYAGGLALQYSDTQPDRIIVAGSSENGYMVARVTSAGVLDPSFSGDGVADIPTATGYGHLTAVRVDYSGLSPRFIAAGFGYGLYGDTDFVLTKLVTNGALDSGFDGDGILSTRVGPGVDAPRAMTLSGSSAIVVGVSAALSAFSTNRDVAILKYSVASGALDSGWNGSGIRLDDVGDIECFLRADELQPDGRLVLCGTTARQSGSYAIALARRMPDGSPDSTFGADGRVVVASSSGATAVALQPDGRLVVADENSQVHRLNGSGSIDSTFGAAGRVVLAIGTIQSTASCVAVQPDGRIVVGLTFNSSPSRTAIAVARLLSNGDRDASFGTNGVATFVVGSGSAEVHALRVLSDGRIVVVGTGVDFGGAGFLTLRLQSGGALDPSFSADGLVITPIQGVGGLACDVEVQDSGGIVVSGIGGPFGGPAFVRYLSDGALDFTFGNSGALVIGNSNQRVSASLQLPDGRILAAGEGLSSDVPSSIDFLALRLTANGSLDSTYGVAGLGTAGFEPWSADHGVSLRLDAYGRALVAGTSDFAFAAARLLGDDVALGVEPRTGSNRLLGLGAFAPNPAAASSRAELTLPAASLVTAGLFDVGGRLVRRLLEGAPLDRGVHSIQWDGLDGDGRRVPDGLYFLRVRAGDRTASRRLTVLR